MKSNIWIIEFVNQKAFDEFEDLPLKIKTRRSHIIKMLEIYGNEVGEPHTASLGEGFLRYELSLARVWLEVYTATKKVEKYSS